MKLCLPKFVLSTGIGDGVVDGRGELESSKSKLHFCLNN